jgi:hypothetical protein
VQYDLALRHPGGEPLEGRVSVSEGVGAVDDRLDPPLGDGGEHRGSEGVDEVAED